MVLVPLVLAAVLAGPSGPAPDRSLATCDGVPVVAHRGVHSRWTTEDSTAAWARAVQKGADVVEGDARLSRSGTWVLMHDATVDRTTRGHGRVSRMSDARLARTRYDDGRVGVSRVADALVAVAASPDTGLEVEIKPAHPSASALRGFVAILAEHGMQGRVTITSFHPAVLARLHRIDPSWTTALITDHRPAHPAALRRYGAQVDLATGAVTARTVRDLHRAGLVVRSWTVDSHRAWRRVVRAGVDGVITDQVTRSRRWCGRTQ